MRRRWSRDSRCGPTAGRVLTTALLVGVGLTTWAQAETTKVVMPRRGICAHRGANSTHPENTLPAFLEAIRLGAHQIELDVRRLKDGNLVVIHDPTVDRTTNGRGRVDGFTLTEIKKLDAGSWKDPKFAGLRIPTLAEALKIMPVNVWVNVHLKGDRQLGKAVAREVVRQKRTHQVILACSRAAAEGARKVHPEILICNMERQSHNTLYVTDTINRKCRFLQLRGGLCKPEDMARLKRAGVGVNYYGTNDATRLRELFDAGVDFPLVDRTAEMIRAARTLGIEPLRPVFRKSPKAMPPAEIPAAPSEPSRPDHPASRPAQAESPGRWSAPYIKMS